MASLGWPFDQGNPFTQGTSNPTQMRSVFDTNPNSAPIVTPTGPVTYGPNAGNASAGPNLPPLYGNVGRKPGDLGYDYFAGYDDLGQLFFNQNPDQAWAHAWSQLGPNTATPWWNWGRQQEGREYDTYLSESAKPGYANLQFSDWINANAAQWWNEFQNLPASQRGVALAYQPAGRTA